MPQSPTLSALSADIAGVARQTAPSVVAVSDGGRPLSGFLWRPDIAVFPAEHLEAKTGDKIEVMLAGSSDPVEGTLVGADPSTDVALVRLAQPGTVLTAGQAGDPALGEAVVAIGRNEHGATCAVGFISLSEGPWRSMRGGEISRRVGVDMRLPRSSEGSALLNASGDLLGMAVLGPRRRVLLIPLATIERVGQELLTHGRIRRGYLGVAVRPVPLHQAVAAAAAGEPGLLVLSLDPKGPAATGGLMQGDIIVSLDGERVRSPRGLVRRLPGSSIGKAVALDLIRAGKTAQVSVSVAEGPAQ